MNTIDWLFRLISFDTTSRNSNLELIKTVQEWFEHYDIEISITRDPSQPKANLFATIPTSDGSKDGGIILSGHTDVVPVDGQPWKTDPFKAVQADGNIYGRGACDMKGFLAVALAIVPELKKKKLSKPVHFAFSYDEEVGCKGVPFLITDFQKSGIKPYACIVGEPTDMYPVIAHKGIQVFKCNVHGQAAHSSLPFKGCNAVEYAAKLINFIRNMAEEFKKNGPFDKHFDLPYTSIGSNMINGGRAPNIIPDHCEFFFEFRHLSEVRPQDIIDKINAYVNNELIPQMQSEQPHTKIEINNVGAIPSFESPQDSAIKQLAQSIIGDSKIRKVAYATEAGLFQQADIPTIVCGPGKIEHAHRENEFVPIEQLRKCEEFLSKVCLTG